MMDDRSLYGARIMRIDEVRAERPVSGEIRLCAALFLVYRPLPGIIFGLDANSREGRVFSFRYG